MFGMNELEMDGIKQRYEVHEPARKGSPMGIQPMVEEECELNQKVKGLKEGVGTLEKDSLFSKSSLDLDASKSKWMNQFSNEQTTDENWDSDYNDCNDQVVVHAVHSPSSLSQTEDHSSMHHSSEKSNFDCSGTSPFDEMLDETLENSDSPSQKLLNLCVASPQLDITDIEFSLSGCKWQFVNMVPGILYIDTPYSLSLSFFCPKRGAPSTDVFLHVDIIYEGQDNTFDDQRKSSVLITALEPTLILSSESLHSIEYHVNFLSFRFKDTYEKTVKMKFSIVDETQTTLFQITTESFRIQPLPKRKPSESENEPNPIVQKIQRYIVDLKESYLAMDPKSRRIKLKEIEKLLGFSVGQTLSLKNPAFQLKLVSSQPQEINIHKTSG